MRYVKLMLHIIETCFPFKGRMYFFKDTLHLLEKKTGYFARDGEVEGFMQLFQGY
jgi:hypothetical protein